MCADDEIECTDTGHLAADSVRSNTTSMQGLQHQLLRFVHVLRAKLLRLLQMVVKCADISHLVADYKISHNKHAGAA